MSNKPRELAQEVIDPDEAVVAAEFIAFLKDASAARHPTGVMPRFNQGRHSGCVDATLTVPDSLPADLRVGLFARPGRYPARIRFANAASTSDREKDLRGMSIQVSVAGDNLTPGASTHDFVLNSHPVMMVGTTREFLELLRAVEAGGVRRVFYFLAHPGAARIALGARANPTSHLDITYWSTTPYLFGPGRAVKYIARPRTRGAATTLPNPLTDQYLRDALAARLADNDAEFDLMVQFQTDPAKMPIEDASVEWKEEDSPYRAVAQIVIPKQKLDEGDRGRFCEEAAFNPWHCLPEHRPLGNFNRARREIYHAMAAFRRERGRANRPAESRV